MAKKNGSISLADFTTTAYLPAIGGVVASFSGFDESEDVILQMGSADLSGAVTCTLQISADGAYWDAAQEDGTDITYSLSSTTPVVDIIKGKLGLLYRIAVTIDSKTGTIDWVLKNVG
jgi:hypothetical protein